MLFRCELGEESLQFPQFGIAKARQDLRRRIVDGLDRVDHVAAGIRQ